MQNVNDNLDTKLSAIDKALAAAKARKAAKDSSPPDAGDEVQTDSAKPKSKSVTQPDFAKQQKKDALNMARSADKERRDLERAERRAAKASTVKGPVHMKKVETAAAKLPALVEAAQILFTDITSNLSREQVTAIALHLQHFNRMKATERALDQRVVTGSQVRIVGGDPRFVGSVGTVERAQRIRCYVTVPNAKKPVYLFTSDVEVLEVSSENKIVATG